MSDPFDPNAQAAAPLLPPPGVPLDAAPSPEPAPAYAPTAPLPMVEATPAPSAPLSTPSAPAKKGGKGLVIGLGAGLVAMVAVAVVGWMGKSSADSDLSDANDRIAVLEADVEARDTQISTLDGEVDNLTTQLGSTEEELTAAQAEVEELTTANGDLEATVSDLEAQVQLLEEQIPDDSALNDNELDLFEYQVVIEFAQGRGADNLTIEQARELGGAVCAAETRGELENVLTANVGLFAPGTPFNDIAFVVGAIAGLMCQNHLQSII